MIEWRRIPEFPEYEVNNIGQVRSWRQREKNDPRNRNRRTRPLPVIIPGYKTPLGYIHHVLRKPGSGKVIGRNGHQLVADAFLQRPHNPAVTDAAHLNGNPSDNRLENLRWTTRLENQMMMAEHGTMQYGEKCITAKLTADQVAEIRRIHAEKGRGCGIHLARQFGITKQQISRIIRGTRWRHLDRPVGPIKSLPGNSRVLLRDVLRNQPGINAMLVRGKGGVKGLKNSELIALAHHFGLDLQAIIDAGR